MRVEHGSIDSVVVRTVRFVSIIGLLIALLSPNQAFAITCRVTLVAMNFGIYMPMTPTHVDINGQVNVRCQAQSGSFSVTIGPGFNGD